MLAAVLLPGATRTREKRGAVVVAHDHAPPHEARSEVFEHPKGWRMKVDVDVDKRPPSLRELCEHRGKPALVDRDAGKLREHAPHLLDLRGEAATAHEGGFLSFGKAVDVVFRAGRGQPLEAVDEVHPRAV